MTDGRGNSSETEVDVPPEGSGIGVYYQYDGVHLYDFLRRLNRGVGPAVLNVGCAAGADWKHLRNLGALRLVGIEPVADAAHIARRHYDEVFEGTLEDYSVGETRAFDTVIFADSLEHIRDSELALRRTNELLKPGGQLVLSIPNIRHLSVLYQVIVRGDWRYEPAGILDHTHVRFFTSRSVCRLLDDHGFDVEALSRWGALPLTRGLSRVLPSAGEFLLSQIVLVAKSSPHGDR